MQGDPRHFESFFIRLGFQTEVDNSDRLFLIWQGTRFPGFLCLGTAVALLTLSLPVALAIHSQGWGTAATSLWYFPVMNLILFAVAFFLLTLKRTILVEGTSSLVTLSKRSFCRHHVISVPFNEIKGLRLGMDQVYSGPAVAGSTTGLKFFPAFSLRLVMECSATILLDRGSRRRIEELAQRLSEKIQKTIIGNEKKTFHNQSGYDI